MSGGSRHTILAATLVAALWGGAAFAADPTTFEARRASVMNFGSSPGYKFSSNRTRAKTFRRQIKFAEVRLASSASRSFSAAR